jgi:hypothetical protein
MKQYRLIDDLLLSFLFEDAQQDIILGPSDGGYIESDGRTVWYVTETGRYESITTPNIIDHALRQTRIVEIFVE